MANNPNAIANLIPAKKGEIRNPNGRPKKFVSEILGQLKEAGYENIKPTQITDIYETLISVDRETLYNLAGEEKQPMIIRIVAKGILSNKGFDIIERMLDRVHGKATQTVIHEGGLFSAQKLTIEEVKPDTMSTDETINKTETSTPTT